MRRGGGLLGWAALLAAALGLGSIGGAAAPPPDAAAMLARGENPYPVALRRPPSAPLSFMAVLGRQIFQDASLSASGRLSCAGCHDPANHFGPPPGLAPAMLGGPALRDQGFRAVPSLAYLERQPPFTVGPDADEVEDTSLAQMVAASHGAARATKTATDTAASAANVVPQGGLFWDGRADTLQQQAIFPLLNKVEMGNPSLAAVAAKLRRTAYAPGFATLFGPGVLQDDQQLVAEAMFAVARYQIEEQDFHPYTSKFDYWLEGRARFTPAEMRGYLAFNDPDRANCGGCHVDQASKDGLPPRFTDGQYEALGAPRNPALAINRDPAFFDRGVCGPYRTDMADQQQFCGMFTTPTLRNVATRQVFFHNGVFHSLQAVMDFYNNRDVAPEKVYPRRADGSVDKYDDMPAADQANIDTVDPPLDRHLGEKPAMSPRDEADIIAFLGTLTDGFSPPAR